MLQKPSNPILGIVSICLLRLLHKYPKFSLRPKNYFSKTVHNIFFVNFHSVLKANVVFSQGFIIRIVSLKNKSEKTVTHKIIFFLRFSLDLSYQNYFYSNIHLWIGSHQIV